MAKPVCCDMRGYLLCLILWQLSKRSMTGAQLAAELGKRKGAAALNPGTIYPALKRLVAAGMVEYKQVGRTKIYRLTPAGRRELDAAGRVCYGTFHDIVKAYER